MLTNKLFLQEISCILQLITVTLVQPLHIYVAVYMSACVHMCAVWCESIYLNTL